MKKIIILFLTCCFLLPSYAFAEIEVVTTLSSFADIVRSIGGEKVHVQYLAPPRFNPHFIEPRPSDVLRLKRADLFVHAGLDLEAWRGPLLDAVGRSDFRAGGSKQLDLSQGISLLEVPTGAISRAEGDIHMFGNPHYWLDPRNALIMAHSISNKLKEIDSSSSEFYKKNEQQFSDLLSSKILEWSKRAAKYKDAEFIGYHNEWIYLMSFLGFKMNQFLEPKPGIPPTPKQLEFLQAYIPEHKVVALIQATYFSKEAGEKLSRDSHLSLLLLCQNVGELPQASDYISMLEYNLNEIFSILENRAK